MCLCSPSILAAPCFHTLVSCSCPRIDLLILYFQIFTNCFFRNSFVLTIICVALCFSVRTLLLSLLVTRHSPLFLANPFPCHTCGERIRKPLGCHTYKKQGVGGDMVNFSSSPPTPV